MVVGKVDKKVLGEVVLSETLTNSDPSIKILVVVGAGVSDMQFEDLQKRAAGIGRVVRVGSSDSSDVEH